MSPETDLSDLGRKLQQKKADAEYRRFREIQQFSHRFRFAGLIMTFFFLILGFVFYMLNLQFLYSLAHLPFFLQALKFSSQ